MNDRSNATTRTLRLAARLMCEENGQTIIVFAIMLVVFLGMAGFVVDIGRAMVANSQLKSGTIAAALAGANEMPNSDYVTVAQNYSSIDQYNSTTKTYTTGNNTLSVLPGVQTQAAGYCSSFVAGTLDVHCVSMGSSSVNALVVTQTVTVPMTFIKILGIDSITFSSTQTAAWKGAARNPYNVAVIVDTTQSMNSIDTGSEAPCSGLSRIACSLIGVQNLLENLTPCSGGASCGTGTKPLDEVALYTFPGLNTSTAVTDDITCNAQMASASSSNYGGVGTTSDSTTYFGFPGSSFSGSALTPDPPIYQLVGFSYDYKSSDTTSALASSNLSKAVGSTGAGTCSYNNDNNNQTWKGIQAVGGAGTYYAGMIYQAQSDLYTNYSSRLTAGTQTSNVMVVLSDGAANATSTQMGGGSSSQTCTKTYTSGSKKGQCETYTTTWSTTSNSNSTGTYPSYKNECQQAVTAAQAATNGTWPSSESTTSPVKTTVYAVAYGAESSGCTTDTSLTPCTTMKQMASSYTTNSSSPTLDFYSDYVASGGDTTCTSSANSTTSIPAIFQEIAANLSASKLMVNPSGCTASSTSTCQ
ncbi:MAG: pilus assembly protein TadG-related protein [Acidobacteriaceae bacterium]